jgi:hypothetical protein
MSGEREREGGREKKMSKFKKKQAVEEPKTQ